MAGVRDPKPDTLDDLRVGQLTRRVAARSGVGWRTCQRVMVALAHEIAIALAEDRRVVWRGVGVVFRRPRPAAVRRNMHGVWVAHGPTKTIVLKASDALRRRIKAEEERWRAHS
jgi:nucleoid DNA-binding protein